MLTEEDGVDGPELALGLGGGGEFSGACAFGVDADGVELEVKADVLGMMGKKLFEGEEGLSAGDASKIGEFDDLDGSITGSTIGDTFGVSERKVDVSPLCDGFGGGLGGGERGAVLGDLCVDLVRGCALFENSAGFVEGLFGGEGEPFGVVGGGDVCTVDEEGGCTGRSEGKQAADIAIDPHLEGGVVEIDLKKLFGEADLFGDIEEFFVGGGSFSLKEAVEVGPKAVVLVSGEESAGVEVALILEDGGCESDFPSDGPGELFPQGLSEVVNSAAVWMGGVEVFDDLDGGVLGATTDLDATVTGDAIALLEQVGGRGRVGVSDLGGLGGASGEE